MDQEDRTTPVEWIDIGIRYDFGRAATNFQAEGIFPVFMLSQRASVSGVASSNHELENIPRSPRSVYCLRSAPSETEMSESGVAEVVTCREPTDPDDTLTEVVRFLGGDDDSTTEHDDVADVMG